MTIQMNEAEVIAALAASGVAIIAAIILFVWLLYRLVRPRRDRRERRPPEMRAAEAEEMLRLIARMEHRLEMLERVVAQDARHEERFLETGEGPQNRRTE